MCMSTSHTRATQSTRIRRHAQHGNVGWRMPQMALTNHHPVLNKSIRNSTLVQPPCLGINVIKNWMLPDTMSYKVCWSFSVSSGSCSIRASTWPTDPVNPTITFDARPCSTRTKPTSPPSSVTRPATCPSTGKRRVPSNCQTYLHSTE